MPAVRAAKVVILDKKGNALLLRRSGTHPRSPHRPDLPGGIIEDGESFEVGACREIQEETGFTIDPKSLRLIYKIEHDFFGTTVYRLVYAVRLDEVTPKVAISWEHDQYDWVLLAELKNLERPYQMGVDYATKHDLWKDV
jgi:8-oxo-dGTP pyrophosphatase MutT (NUDIX family)